MLAVQGFYPEGLASGPLKVSSCLFAYINATKTISSAIHLVPETINLAPDIRVDLSRTYVIRK